MKRRLRHWAKWTIKGLIALSATVLILIWFVLGTEPGAQLTLRLVLPRLPIDLQFSDVSGRLMGPLVLTDVTFATGPLELGAERVALDWQPLELLLDDRLHLSEVRMIGFRGAVRASEPDSAPPSLPTETTELAKPKTTGLLLPFVVAFDELHLQGDSLVITDEVAVRDFRLSAAGSLDDYRAELAALFEAPVLDAAAVAISGRGSVSEFVFERLSADVLDGRVQGTGSLIWLPEVEWIFSVAADDLAPARVAPQPEDWPGQVAMRGAVSGSIRNGELQLRAEIDTLFGSLRDQPLAGTAAGTIHGPRYSIEALDIDWGEVTVNAIGVVATEELDLDFHIDVPDLAEVLPRSSGTLSATGRLKGTLATPIIVADAAARHVSLGQVKLGAADASIDVDWINGQRNEASITASQLEIPGQVIDSLRIDLRGARDSHQLAAEIVSRDADVSLSAVGGFSERSWAGELVGVSIDSPEYGGWGVAEPTRLSVSDNSVVVSLLCLRERAGGVCLEGSWEKEVGWRAEAVFNEFPLEVLRFALPEGWALEGSVSGELSGSAVRGWPQQLDLDLQPSDGELTYLLADSAHVLRYRQARLAVHADPDSTRARVDIDLAEAGKEDYGSFDLYANLPPLRALADEFSLEGEPQRGWLGEAVVRDFPLSLIDLVLPEGWAAEGTVSGSMALALMVDRPQRLAVDLYPSAGALTYAIGDSTHGIRYREGHVAVRSNPDSLWGQVDLQLSEASADEYGALRIHANLPPLSSLRTEVASEGWGETLIDGWVLAASMNDAPLSLAKPFLPSGMSLSGALDGEIDADVAPDGSLGGEIRLQAQNAAMHRLVGREVRTVRIADTRISGRAGAEGLHGDLVLKFARPDSGSLATITGSLGFPSYVNLHQEFTEQALEARIDGQMDLGLIDALVEGLAGSSGQLDIEIDVGGTVDEPLTSGHYVVNGQTNVPSLGLTLRDIEVRATSRTRGDFEIEGGLSSGAGRLAISGRSPPIPSSESPARITVQGSDFLAAQTDQVTLVVSPDLEVLLTGEQVIVNGDVTVPRAAIEILEVPETAASVSEDVVFVGDTIVEERRPLDVSAEVRLVLGEDVTFRGFGFSTHLDGTIVTTETPGRGTEGRGELVFREGRYRGFGQSLTIDPGRLVFAGPVDDPTLDVRAYRRADDGTRAGFLIGGTLQSPEVEVWSDPARSQQEALSYILFGRPLDQGTESDRAQAGSEAAILGGNILAMSMATRVGLDEARIETGNRREDAAFYAGKYLSPKLYVAYGVGLYEPVNVIRVRYIISRKLSLQAETGSRDSGDILYRIEF